MSKMMLTKSEQRTKEDEGQKIHSSIKQENTKINNSIAYNTSGGVLVAKRQNSKKVQVTDDDGLHFQLVKNGMTNTDMSDDSSQDDRNGRMPSRCNSAEHLAQKYERQDSSKRRGSETATFIDYPYEVKNLTTRGENKNSNKRVSKRNSQVVSRDHANQSAGTRKTS